MPAHVKCPNCRGACQVAEACGGKSARCPRCLAVFPVAPFAVHVPRTPHGILFITIAGSLVAIFVAGVVLTARVLAWQDKKSPTSQASSGPAASSAQPTQQQDPEVIAKERAKKRTDLESELAVCLQNLEQIEKAHQKARLEYLKGLHSAKPASKFKSKQIAIGDLHGVVQQDAMSPRIDAQAVEANWLLAEEEYRKNKSDELDRIKELRKKLAEIP